VWLAGNLRWKNTLFSCALQGHASCMQMCSLRLQFADLFHDLPMAHKITVNQTGAFYFSQVLRMSSIFSRNKLMIPIVLFQSLWMFFGWLVFTSNLNSQTTWLIVKLKLVNLNCTILVHVQGLCHSALGSSHNLIQSLYCCLSRLSPSTSPAHLLYWMREHKPIRQHRAGFNCARVPELLCQRFGNNNLLRSLVLSCPASCALSLP